MPNNQKTDDIYHLSPVIKIVEGIKSWSLMNLQRGEIILINQSAAETLTAFSKGACFREVFELQEIPETHQEDVISFLKKCVDSEILLNINEVNNVKTSLPNRPRHISSRTLSMVLELSTKCNLRCQHCYNNSGSECDDKLSLTIIKKILTEIKSSNKKLKTLTLTGGEPFLFNDLPEVLNLALEHNLPAIRINTNGTIFSNLLFSNIDQKLSEIMTIQVTLLGASEETHDLMTRFKGSFLKTTENIPKFQGKGFNVGISFIRSKNSEHEFEKALRLGEKLGVEVTAGDLFPLGRAADNFSDLELESKDREMFVACDGKYYGGKGAGKLSEENRLSLLETFPPDLPCGKDTVAITSNGDVIPCMLLQGIIVGNIHKQSLPKIMQSSSMSNFRNQASIENRQFCSECELRYACSNKCPAVSLSYGGDILKKNPFCSYY